MNIKDINTIKQLIENELNHTDAKINSTDASTNRPMFDHLTNYLLDLSQASDAVDRLQKSRESTGLTSQEILNKANGLHHDGDCKMIAQAEAVKQLLDYCAILPGAKITITVEHDHGQRATAELYDLAALVQELWRTLDYFISEMLY